MRVRTTRKPGGRLVWLEIPRKGRRKFRLFGDVNDIEFTVNAPTWGEHTGEMLMLDALKKCIMARLEILTNESLEGDDGQPVDASPRRNQRGVKIPPG